jgi:hypothetical protein
MSLRWLIRAAELLADDIRRFFCPLREVRVSPASVRSLQTFEVGQYADTSKAS